MHYVMSTDDYTIGFKIKKFFKRALQLPAIDLAININNILSITHLNFFFAYTYTPNTHRSHQVKVNSHSNDSYS